MKHLAYSITLILGLTGGAHAQDYLHGQPGTSYNNIGRATFGSDGTSYNRMGNSTFGSDGSYSTRIGNSTFRSDGTSSNQIGNTRPIQN